MLSVDLPREKLAMMIILVNYALWYPLQNHLLLEGRNFLREILRRNFPLSSQKLLLKKFQIRLRANCAEKECGDEKLFSGLGTWKNSDQNTETAGYFEILEQK